MVIILMASLKMHFSRLMAPIFGSAVCDSSCTLVALNGRLRAGRRKQYPHSASAYLRRVVLSY